MLTETPLFGKWTGPEAVFEDLGRLKPPKPTSVPELGFSDTIWKFLEGYRQPEHQLRASAKHVLVRIKSNASTRSFPAMADL